VENEIIEAIEYTRKKLYDEMGKRLMLILSIFSVLFIFNLLPHPYYLKEYIFPVDCLLVAYMGFIIQKFEARFRRLYTLLNVSGNSTWNSKHVRRFVVLSILLMAYDVIGLSRSWSLTYVAFLVVDVIVIAFVFRSIRYIETNLRMLILMYVMVILQILVGGLV